MPSLQAPPTRSFPTVDQGVYIGAVESVAIEDHTTEPDKFGRKGYTFIFRWVLEGVTAEDGSEIVIPQYVRFETGDRPYARGPRTGKLPWLTEITRALGQPDIKPGDDVDPDDWKGMRAKLSVLEQVSTDGTVRNQINGIQPPPKKSKAAPPPPKAVRVAPPPPDDDEEDEGDIPF